MRVASNLVALVLHVIIAAGWLLQSLVLIQELGRCRFDFLLDFEDVVCLVPLNICSQRNHPITLDDIVVQRERTDLELVDGQ